MEMAKAKSYPTLRSARRLELIYEIPISKTQKFWEKLEEGKVFTTRCKDCGKIYFPPSGDCVDCLTSDMEWVELSGEAVLVTFTQVAVRPQTFSDYEPYIVAVGKLKEGVNVLAWLTGIKLEDVKIGMKMRLIGKVSREGRGTYEFIPGY